MNRRTFIQLLLASSAFAPQQLWAAIQQIGTAESKKVLKPEKNEPVVSTAKNGMELPEQSALKEENILDYLSKIRAPNIPHKDDIYASQSEFTLLRAVIGKLRRIVSLAGDGHFCVMGFDEALTFADNAVKIGSFTRQEKEFMEKLFYRDANVYGFYGEKQLQKITQEIDKREIYKVPYSGNYLFKGESLKKYELVRRNLGEELILTSGVRGVMKQFYLFANKAIHYDGNLSLASRSLAPPGYSYHATGDFDVGQKGFGSGNFSESFLSTAVYQQLSQQGYVQYRYGRDNLLGVRFEPWHIKL